MNWANAFNNTTAGSNGDFEKIPEGTYTAKIEKAIINEASKFGPRVEITLSMTSPEYKNRKCWMNYSLDEKGTPWLKKDLQTLGHEVNKAEDLESALTSILESDVEIFIKYKEAKNKMGELKQYQQTFINSLCESSSQEELPF